MRLTQIHIDGYGIYADFTSPRLHPQVVVFSGANEAGKSTLLWFIRQVLFGFPDRRQRNPRYPPLRGGRFGGWLDLVDARGNTYRVERREGRGGGQLIIRVNGAVGTRGDLERILGGVPEDVFRSVFAFSLEELSRLGASFGEELQSRIYGAGLTGRGPHILDVEADLDRKVNELLSPRAGRIRELVAQHDRLRTELAELRKGTAQYDELVRREAELRQWLEQAEPELMDRTRRLAYLESALKAWNSWVLLRSAEDELEAMPVIEEFPDDGISRLERLTERLGDLRSRKVRLDQRVEAIRREIDETTVDEDLIAVADRVQALYRRIDHYLSAARDLPVLKGQLEVATTSVEQTLADLGVGWTRELIRSFDASIPVRQAVARHREAIQQVERNLLSSQQAEQQRQEEVEQAQEVLRQRQHRLNQLPLSMSGNATQAQARVTGARRLLQEVRSADAAEKELRHQKTRCDDLQRQLQMSQRASRLGAIVSYKVIAVFALVAAGGAILAAVGEHVGGAFVSATGLVLALVLLYLKRSGPSQDTGEAVAAALRQEISDLEQNIAKTTKMLQCSHQAIAEQATSLGVEPLSDPHAAEELLNQALLDEQLVQRREDSAAQVREAEEAHKAATGRLKQAIEARETAQTKANQVHQAWRDWLREHNLATDLSPETVLEMFRLIQVAREQMNAEDSLKQRVQRVEEQIKGFHAELDSLRGVTGRQAKEENAAAAVQRLYSDLERAREAQRKLADLKQQLGQDETERADVDRAIAEASKELDGLLSAAGASDAEDFRQKAKTFEARLRLKAEIEKHQNAIRTVSGPGEAYDNLIHFLRTRDASILEAETTALRESLEQKRQQEQQIREEIGQIRAQIAELEAQIDASAKLLELRQTEAKLSIALREWAVASIARHILSQAREEYEREHQPQVVKFAERFFATITRGRYPRLFVSAETQEIQLEDYKGERKTVAELSRGTAEQLYLAMRLGLLTHMSETGEPLPVIMDDVLVNFDPQRAEQTCRALAELSRASQVLYFTCHPETVTFLAQATNGNCQIIDLGEVTSRT
jgi:uncharacterized protein YhaN